MLPEPPSHRPSAHNNWLHGRLEAPMTYKKRPSNPHGPTVVLWTQNLWCASTGCCAVVGRIGPFPFSWGGRSRARRGKTYRWLPSQGPLWSLYTRSQGNSRVDRRNRCPTLARRPGQHCLTNRGASDQPRPMAQRACEPLSSTAPLPASPNARGAGNGPKSPLTALAGCSIECFVPIYLQAALRPHPSPSHRSAVGGRGRGVRSEERMA